MKRKAIRRLAVPALLMLIASSAAAGPIRLSFHDTTVVGGTLFEYPVFVDSATTGLNVISYQVEFTFNGSLCTFIDAQSTAAMTAGWTMDYNVVSPGRIRVTGSGAAPLTGTGKLVILRFLPAVFANTQYGAFSFQSTLLNEGSPSTAAHNGTVTIQPPPFITVSPNTTVLTKGDSQQFTVSGGTGPYSWSSTNSSVASINASGLLTALHAGTTRIVCIDSAGITDTSGIIEVRALKLWLRDTSQYQGQWLDLPVYATDVTGLGITSGQFSITYNQALWMPGEIVTAGTLLHAASMDTFSITANTINVTFASSTPLAGSGILLFIRMKASVSSYGGSGFTFVNPLFNETILANTAGGNITAIQLAPVNVTPSGTQTMLAGDSLQFFASGGTAPYSWSVSDPTRASISSTGWLKALKSGIDTARAHDALGAFGSSGRINIYDFRLSVPDTSLIPAATVDIPLSVTGNAAGFFSLEMKVSYSTTSYVRLLDVVTAGTLTSGWTIDTSYSAGSVKIVAAAVNPVYSGGTLLVLRFAVPDSTPRPSTVNLSLSEVRFNEGYPLPLIDQGYFTVANRSVFGITPASGTIESAAIGMKDSITFTVHNSGTATLTSSMGIIGSGEFTLSTYNISVPPSDSAAITAYYVPSGAGTDTATIQFNTNDPYHPTVPVTIIGKIVLFPIINIQPVFIDFGGVKVGESKDTTVTITNTGSDTLKVTSVTGSNGAFTAHPAAFHIPPGGSITDTLRFTPAVVSTLSSHVLVVSNASGSPDTIAVHGEGLTPLIVGQNANVPKQFSLLQNFPNPFNPSTTIRYALPAAAHVRLTVHDLLGREIATLVDEEQPAGWSAVRWDASRSSSGIYFYRIRAGDAVEMKRMILVK